MKPRNGHPPRLRSTWLKAWNAARQVPADYPPDQYWKGESPREDYNYLLVDVQPGQKTKFTLNRFRPQSAEPYGSVELFQASR